MARISQETIAILAVGVALGGLFVALNGNLEERFDRFEAQVNARIDGIEVRMDRIETRMDGIETRMGRLEKRMDGIEVRMAAIETRMDGIETRMDRIEQRMDRFETRLDRTDARIGAVEAQVARLSGALEAVGVLAIEKKLSERAPSGGGGSGDTEAGG